MFDGHMAKFRIYINDTAYNETTKPFIPSLDVSRATTVKIRATHTLTQFITDPGNQNQMVKTYYRKPTHDKLNLR